MEIVSGVGLANIQKSDELSTGIENQEVSR